MGEKIPEINKFLKVLDCPCEKEQFHYEKSLSDTMDILLLNDGLDVRNRYLASEEHTTLDEYVLFAVSALQLADLGSIYRYLVNLKRLNPKLQIPRLAEEEERSKILHRALNRLVRGGFLYGVQYVVMAERTKQEAYEEARRIREEEFFNSAEYIEEYIKSIDEAENVDQYYYDKKGDNKEIATIKMRRNARLQSANETLGLGIDQIRTLYGENARLVRLYGLQDSAYIALKQRFLNLIPEHLRYVSIMSPTVRVGLGATGLVASHLTGLKTFRKQRFGVVNSVNIGKFVVPEELSFEVKTGDDKKYIYTCALLPAYVYRDEYLDIKGLENARGFGVVEQIRNYIGINGLKGDMKDAIVVVVVNDGEDLVRFTQMLIDGRATTPELNRIFFTSERIVQFTNIGVRYMLQTYRVNNGGNAEFEFKVSPFPIK